MNKYQIENIKQFIRDNINNIKSRNYKLLYDKLDNIDSSRVLYPNKYLTPAFTEILLEIRENPLFNIDYTPECFAMGLKIKEITIPPNIEYIKSAAFYNCKNLKNVNFLGEGLKSIGKTAFQNCGSLEIIRLPNSVEYIDDYAFKDCAGLKYIYIGNNLKEFSTDIFEGCVVIQEIYIDTTLDRLNRIFLNGEDIPSIELIKCKDGLVKFNYITELWEKVE